ncbi:MAG: DNA mismatch repair endonuclease MutL [Dehalococcoidia bacterium]|nr:DNA mismatch repair endonuclease MutL [Dehalococcoidia bacterium]
MTAPAPPRRPQPRARIAVLPPEVAARIAAGEVIERPASVVKELVENAIDAGAAHVAVEIVGGGGDRIRVSDDGCGIPPEQVADAFERHATSKLRSEHDLFAVRTLGFRGEALAAIAAAAEVDLVSRPAGQDAAAAAHLRDGRLERVGSAAAAPGTSVEVRELFAALPARRRFLRPPRAEARAVVELIAALALAHPEVAFRLVSDGRVALASPGTGDPRDAVAAVHGVEVARALVPAGARRQEADGAAVDVTALVGPPSLHRGSRGAIHLVANGRTIGSRSIAYAIEQAYAGLIPAGRHPVAIVRIDVPPEQIDVNVHPTKAEVRFRHERLVYAAVAEAVRGALTDAPIAFAPLTAGAWPARGAREAPSEHAEDDGAAGAAGRAVIAGARPAPIFAPPLTMAAGAAQAGLAIEARTPALRPLGQIDRTYLVAESADGLYLVDQHAAHERVLYEQALAARAAGRPASQPLLAALAVPLSASQAALAAAEAEALAAIGWEVAPTDGAAVLLRAVPAALAGRDAAAALRDYLDRLDAEERLTGPDRAAATLACRAAVMAGDPLDGEQQRALLRALEACATPHTCPHGRPTMLHLSRAALERSFGRR